MEYKGRYNLVENKPIIWSKRLLKDSLLQLMDRYNAKYACMSV